MIQPWITVLVAILYISILFAVASYGDRARSQFQGSTQSKRNIYAFSLAVYCTTWTFFGSVGLAATSGINFLAIYLGPILLFTVGFPVLHRIVTLSREERITSVADFLGSRYGKNNKVAAVAAIIAVVGTVPYIALQLKAISSSVDTLVTEFSNGFPIGSTPFGDITLAVALVLGLFAVLFGTRHADATEHQHGLMLAVALESVIKLIAFLCVGAFVTWFMFDGIGDLLSKASENVNIQKIVDKGFDAGNFLILLFLSLTVFLLLPRQFHVTVVENTSDNELHRARWLFPLYLVAINIFVIPIAVAGTLQFGITANADDFVLLLPILEGQRALGLLVFLGGLSAGTAMVVVASVALAIMISNDLVLPLILRSRVRRVKSEPANMERRILNIRRTAIFVVMGLAYIYYAAADNTAALASIGLISFAAIAQLAPSFFVGMYWRNANSRGAMTGMLGGFVVWAYCLLLPTLLPEDSTFVTYGPFGISGLRPENLFNLEMSSLANGVIWSLLVNTALFVFGSMSRSADPQEVLQSSMFANYQGTRPYGLGAGATNVRVHHLKETLSRYLGTLRTNRSFDIYLEEKGRDVSPDGPVDEDMLRFSEQLLASAVGASSSRLVHTLLIQRHGRTNINDLKLLDEASRAIQFNRDILQTAFNQLEQGVTVFDGDYRLASWNRQFRNILQLPDEIGRAGLPLTEVCVAIVDTNNLENAGISADDLATALVKVDAPWQLTLPDTKRVIEIGANTMPGGGVLITWHEITARVRAAEALKEANESLERRVEERTRELEQAKQFADQANASKTRFLAAAGHDIVQPLNAARLYVTTLMDSIPAGREKGLAENIGKSLGSVEEILGSVLAISRLDSASPEVNISNFPLSQITEQLEIEFEPIANKAGLELRFIHTSKWVRSDPAQLRRLIQNLISNALKFTKQGKVLVGVRRSGSTLRFEVHDTGIGITEEDQREIFTEFTRLNKMDDQVPGLGLGLSIVERISKLLGHEVALHSKHDRGTRFSVMLEAVEPAVASHSKNTQTGHGIRKSRGGRLAGMRVLCIDNETEILSGMEALLGHWGCEVRIARDLAEAEKELKKFASEPHMVLVDYHLDKTTGIEVYRELKNLCGVELTGVLITADRSEEVKQLAADSGLMLLNKPLKPAALRAILSRYSLSREAAE